MSYEEGSQKIKTQTNDFWKQSWNWTKNGISFIGGASSFIGGIALCKTGVGCVFGLPLMTHGANNFYEGGKGIVNGLMNLKDGGDRDINVDGPLREFYKSSARNLGFDDSVGDLVYDITDLGLAGYGALRLIPKLNEFGNTQFKLFHYGRQDFQRAYQQMSKISLWGEVIGDGMSLAEIAYKSNLFILNNNTEQVNMVITKPETITNIKQIVDDCSLIITKTGDDGNLKYYDYIESDNNTKPNAKGIEGINDSKNFENVEGMDVMIVTE